MDRDELKEYNREHKLGIVINKSITDEAFRSMIRDAEKQKEGSKEPIKEEVKEEKANSVAVKNDLPWEKGEQTKEQIQGDFLDPKTEVAEEKKPVGVKSSVADRLAKLKGDKK